MWPSPWTATTGSLGIRGLHRRDFRFPYGKKGQRIVGYDNEKGKGDHRHYQDREAPYAFTTVERFIEDFNADVKREEQQ